MSVEVAAAQVAPALIEALAKSVSDAPASMPAKPASSGKSCPSK